MDSWEQDADAWKKAEAQLGGSSDSDEPKPWEEADGWKLEGGYQPGETEAKQDPRVSRFLEVTIGVRPTVPTMQVENTPDITVKDRDALKLVVTLSTGQKATTDEGEVFQFSSKRHRWVRIPWEVC